MASMGDDRLVYIVPFVVERLEQHAQRFANMSDAPPLVVGLNGIQGCGKSTVVERLQEALSNPPHSLHIVVFSIDDLYLPHDQQVALAESHASNPLVQHRGQPSTHDVELGKHILESLRANKATEIPIYDKSAFSGQGDRVTNKAVKVDAEKQKVDLVILEGWFTGFRSLPPQVLTQKWEAARNAAQNDSSYPGRLGHNSIDSISFINDELRRYDALTDQFDALVHVDAVDTRFVYEWRLEAEHQLRQRTGSGMTDNEVKTFVDGCMWTLEMAWSGVDILDYPSYELYTDQLRSGAFPGETGKQLRLVVDKDRRVKDALVI